MVFASAFTLSSVFPLRLWPRGGLRLGTIRRFQAFCVSSARQSSASSYGVNSAVHSRPIPSPGLTLRSSRPPTAAAYLGLQGLPPHLQAIPHPGFVAQRQTQAWFSTMSDQLWAWCVQRVDAWWQTVRTARLQTVIALPFSCWQQTLMKDARRGLHSLAGLRDGSRRSPRVHRAFPGAGPTFCTSTTAFTRRISDLFCLGTCFASALTRAS